MLARRVVAGFEVEFGESATDTLVAVKNLGSLLRDKGNVAEAEPMLRRGMDGFLEAFGLDHQLTVGARIALALLLAQQGRGEEEVARLAHFDGKAGPQAASTLKDARRLVDVLRSSLQLSQAEALARTFGFDLVQDQEYSPGGVLLRGTSGKRLKQKGTCNK